MVERAPGGLVGVSSWAAEDEWWAWKWSYSIRGVLEQIDETAREAYRRAAFDAMQPIRETAGFPMRLTACFAFGRKGDS